MRIPHTNQFFLLPLQVCYLPAKFYYNQECDDVKFVSLIFCKYFKPNHSDGLIRVCIYGNKRAHIFPIYYRPERLNFINKSVHWNAFSLLSSAISSHYSFSKLTKNNCTAILDINPKLLNNFHLENECGGEIILQEKKNNKYTHRYTHKTNQERNSLQRMKQLENFLKRA